MTTRAQQFSIFLAGLRDSTGAAYDSYVLNFYEPGTLTAKNVWTEEEKTNAYSEYTLDSSGAATLYGDGVYKIVLEDTAGSTVETWEDFKIQYPLYNVVSVSATYSHTVDDDELVVDTSGGDITVTLLAASAWEKPLRVRNTGANDVILDGNGAETIEIGPSDSQSTFTVSSSGHSTLLSSDGTNVRIVGIPAIIGNGTLGVLRSAELTIANGSAANTITVTLADIYNGDSFSATGDIAKNAKVSGVALHTDGDILYIGDSVITGSVTAVIGCWVSVNTTTVTVTADPAQGTHGAPLSEDGIAIQFTDISGTDRDLAALVDLGTPLTLGLLYLTDE
ncbi:MAG: hypothetical protein GY845_30370 [Planctomycetes bacterium]|nr:hypothetical protein [Planctomycetota bacterium]